MGEGAAPVLLLGAGGFAVEVAELVDDCPGLSVAGFVESLDRSRCGLELRGLPVHWVGDIGPLAESHLALSAVGTTSRDGFTRQVEAVGMRFATVVHPTAHVSASAALDAGVLVGAGVIVGAESRIGRHAILNRGVLVGHHVEIGAHASVMPGANVAGFTTIGEQTLVGMGALVLNNLRVGREAVIAAGSVVTHDVADRALVRGSPAQAVELAPR
jgi:sugar O-acyltransferase (sialic acid O-acetyltransferase NeuD family)